MSEPTDDLMGMDDDFLLEGLAADRDEILRQLADAPDEEGYERRWPMLARLVAPFHDRLVKKKAGNDYVPHSLVWEKVAAVIGPHSFEVIREIYEGDGRLTGVVGQITAVIDGRPVRVSEIGDVEEHVTLLVDEYGDPIIDPATGEQKVKELAGNNGARGKVAASDAYKRCAMRLGCGVELYSREKTFIHDVLMKREDKDR